MREGRGANDPRSLGGGTGSAGGGANGRGSTGRGKLVDELNLR